MSHNPATFNDCRQLVRDRVPFSFNHVFADLEDGFTTGYSNKPPIYKIYSYSRDNPILVFDFGREEWIGLKDVPNDKISQLHMSLVDSAAINHWASHQDLAHISINGLPGDVTNPKYTADKFIKARSRAELLAEYVAINGPIHDHPIPGATIKKITIKNPRWYHKVVGMLSHNYATISQNLHGKTVVYFFYDDGRYHGLLPKNISMDCKNSVFSSTSCIIDSIELKDVKYAEEILYRNGFELITKEIDQKFRGHLSAHKPKGEIFFDMREFTVGPYSQGGHWDERVIKTPNPNPIT